MELPTNEEIERIIKQVALSVNNIEGPFSTYTQAVAKICAAIFRGKD
jgi:hypothetical protein